MEVPEREMRVALFQPVLSHYRIDLFNEVDRRLGNGVTVYTVDASKASLLGGTETKLTTARAASPTYRAGPLWFVPRLLQVVCQRRWDVVVVSWNARQVEILPALVLARLRKVPVILWGHGFSRRGSSTSAWLRRSQVRLASAVVTYSERGRSEVIDQVPAALVRVVLNTTGRPGSEAASPLVKVSRRVAYLGRLLEQKHGERLIEAVGQLRSDGLDLEVDVVGDGPYRSVMEGAARRSDVEDLITWHGQVTEWSEVSEIIAGCDLVVLPSRAGLAVVDGFAVGRAAVVLDDPAMNPPEADLVVEGVTGFKYEPATASALAAKLREIYSAPERVIEASRGALNLYREHLTVDVAAADFKEVLREVVGRR